MKRSRSPDPSHVEMPCRVEEVAESLIENQSKKYKGSFLSQEGKIISTNLNVNVPFYVNFEIFK